jgi:hypothetical protein
MSFKHDPIYDDPEIRPLIHAAWFEASIQVKEKYGEYDCNVVWLYQKKILLEKYGIKWRSPSDLNRSVLFD